MKMTTTIPFTLNDLEHIRKYGATIDLSKLNFNQYDQLKQFDPIDLAIKYISNVYFMKINLDFSNTTFNFKSTFLLKYITNYRYLKLKELQQTILSLKQLKYSNTFNYNSIFSIDEANMFLNLENTKYI